MGEVRQPELVLLIVAVISRHGEALAWTRERAEREFGPAVLVSAAFEFMETDYYTATMGPALWKQFLAFERLADPAVLASVKRATNAWEAEYAALGRHEEPRPLNLDPGYITPAKLVLASTKDHAHRLYLRDGIYAETTLMYRRRSWQPLEWTYPDYRREDFHEFFRSCREWLLNCGKRSSGLE
ncbi:MAG: DUF4416 family protein [Pirellulales bacterium]|nr:DUF4416 family protein [Pirellulales bacterium]